MFFSPGSSCHELCVEWRRCVCDFGIRARSVWQAGRRWFAGADCDRHERIGRAQVRDHLVDPHRQPLRSTARRTAARLVAPLRRVRCVARPAEHQRVGSASHRCVNQFTPNTNTPHDCYCVLVPCDHITTMLHVSGSMLRRLLLRWPSLVSKATSCTLPPATATPATFDTIASAAMPNSSSKAPACSSSMRARSSTPTRCLSRSPSST